MATEQLTNDTIIPFDAAADQPLKGYVLSRLYRILKTSDLFHLLFIAIITAEVLYFFLHLSLFAQNLTLAIHAALLFATVFTYLTLRLYFQARKVESLVELKNSALAFSRNEADGLPPSEFHLIVGHECCKLADALHACEYSLYTPPRWLEILSTPLQKLCCWAHWQDAHFMKELLLEASVEEHIKRVHVTPTCLETHAGLANAYVMLSGLYVDPRTIEGLDDGRWIPPNKYTPALQAKFRSVAKKAIEEFKILSDYAPEDPWVYLQLAYSYHDLQMPEEEIKAYETVLRFCPDDEETQYKLGKLYFKQGFNARGLSIYEQLKRIGSKKAERLITYYGALQQPESD